MDKWGAHGPAHFRNAAYRKGKECKDTKEEFKKCCLCELSIIRKANSQLELRLAMDVKGTRFYHNIGSKIMNKGNMILLLTDCVGMI